MRPLPAHLPHLVLQDEVTGPVQGVVVQIRLGREHQQLWQQGVQEKALPFEGPQVLEAARAQEAGNVLSPPGRALGWTFHV